LTSRALVRTGIAGRVARHIGRGGINVPRRACSTALATPCSYGFSTTLMQPSSLSRKVL
jgi:hypothetical protein